MENYTIRQQLLQLGMKETEIDNHESDLYVLKNEVTEKWLKGYEHKQNVKSFISETDGKQWYEIPFGYMPEHYAMTKGGKL